MRPASWEERQRNEQLSLTAHTRASSSAADQTEEDNGGGRGSGDSQAKSSGKGQLYTDPQHCLDFVALKSRLNKDNLDSMSETHPFLLMLSLE